MLGPCAARKRKGNGIGCQCYDIEQCYEVELASHVEKNRASRGGVRTEDRGKLAP
jgi:hypothetical protein